MNKLNHFSYRNTITIKGGWLLVKNPCLISPWNKIFFVVDHGILHYSDIEINMKTSNNSYSHANSHNNQYDSRIDNHNDSICKTEDNKVFFMT